MKVLVFPSPFGEVGLSSNEKGGQIIAQNVSVSIPFRGSGLVKSIKLVSLQKVKVSIPFRGSGLVKASELWLRAQGL